MKKNGIIMVAYCMNEVTIIQYLFGEQHIAEYVKNERVTADFKGVSEPNEVFDLMRVCYRKMVELTKKGRDGSGY